MLRTTLADLMLVAASAHAVPSNIGRIGLIHRPHAQSSQYWQRVSMIPAKTGTVKLSQSRGETASQTQTAAATAKLVSIAPGVVPTQVSITPRPARNTAVLPSSERRCRVP
jgi:hypothetical protein